MNQKGQSLVEAVIALGAAVVIVAAITVASITSIRNSDYSRVQNLATNYAQQGMELVKQKNQLSWSSLEASISAANTWCLPSGATDLVATPQGSSSCPVNIQSSPWQFIRQIDFKTIECNGDPQVTVTVSWTDGRCSSTPNISYCHSVSLASCLGNIYSAP
jgi:Tfp pilus assembly protein PilW